MKPMLWLCRPLLLFAAGCASSSEVRWMTEDIHPVAVRGDRRLDEVRIWTHDSLVHWRAVLVTRDSISGVPDTRSACENCRRALPVSAVDSLSVGYANTAIAKRDGDRESPIWTPLLILALILCP